MIEVWTDGSSHSSGGKPIGWGWLVLLDGELVDMGYGGAPSGTNNEAELTAAIRGLEAAKRLVEGTGACPITLVSDSQYTLGMASGAFNPSKNLALVKSLRSLALELGATTRWVRGHDGVKFNEFVDTLAKCGKEENTN